MAPAGTTQIHPYPETLVPMPRSDEHENCGSERVSDKREGAGLKEFQLDRGTVIDEERNSIKTKVSCREEASEGDRALNPSLRKEARAGSERNCANKGR